MAEEVMASPRDFRDVCNEMANRHQWYHADTAAHVSQGERERNPEPGDEDAP